MSTPFIGEIRLFAGNFAPQGFAFCNGQLMSIAQYSALFALLGTTYGGDGQTTFALPNLQSRVPVGQGQGPGLSNRVIGQMLGSENVTLLASQIPAHSHAPQASLNTAASSSGPTGVEATSAGTSLYGSGNADQVFDATAVGAAGGGQAHNNVAPYLALNFIIALEGIFPSRN